MITVNKQQIKTYVIAIICIFVAFSCRRLAVCTNLEFLDKLLNYIRTFIYIGLYYVWGISVHRRVIHPQSRKILFSVSMLMIFWFIVREIKYRFIFDLNLIRYFWYFYYIPLILIPLLALWVSILQGKPKDYSYFCRFIISFLAAFLFICFVLTNDMHQLMFAFPANEAVWTEFNRTLGMGYYVFVGWCLACFVSSMIIMLKKCRIPNSRKRLWLPYIPFIFAILYFVLYALNLSVVIKIFNDFAAFFCIIIVSFFESCIQCGLIPSNSHYSDLFGASVDMEIQILDENYDVAYHAGIDSKVQKDVMKKAEQKPVIIGEKRLKNMSISGGHVIWMENISELIHFNEILEERRDELKERNALLQYEYKKEKEYRTLEEQNRLYDLLQDKTQFQIDCIEQLVYDYSDSKEKAEKQKILAKIMILGSYIKRSKDFVLSMDEMPILSQRKLESAFRESFRALKHLNIKGDFYVGLQNDELAAHTLILAYDFFEDVIETVLDQIQYINVRVCNVNQKPRINIMLDAASEHTKLVNKYPAMRLICEEDEVFFILPLEGGSV